MVEQPVVVQPALLKVADDFYAFLKSGTVAQDGHNIMLYRDDVPNVEVGVQVAGTFEAAGRVTPSSLPSGPAAMATHVGPYDGLREAHRAVLAWCKTQGYEPTGVRWEIYDDWHEDSAKLETEVWYQLR